MQLRPNTHNYRGSIIVFEVNSTDIPLELIRDIFFLRPIFTKTDNFFSLSLMDRAESFILAGV